MENPAIIDPLFTNAIEAIDLGNITVLENLLAQHPQLARERLSNGEDGYFKDPYLIWFVADNPIRKEKLPDSIVAITKLLTIAVKREATDTWQQQLDYTLDLVATGRIPHESGKQIEMMDVLIDAGAAPGGGLGALAHGNIAAAEHLIKRGGKLTLPAAVGLGQMDDVKRMASTAEPEELLTALTTAAFYGKADMITYLLSVGAHPNGYPKNGEGFHSHAMPLHQAVYSGSLEAVQLLVEAGAKLDATDLVYEGTPLGWAMHMQSDENTNDEMRRKYAAIEDYLKGVAPSKSPPKGGDF